MLGHLETRGMLLSFSLESELSHTSIPYYYDMLKMKIYEYWSQADIENNDSENNQKWEMRPQIFWKEYEEDYPPSQES